MVVGGGPDVNMALPFEQSPVRAEGGLRVQEAGARGPPCALADVTRTQHWSWSPARGAQGHSQLGNFTSPHSLSKKNKNKAKQH